MIKTEEIINRYGLDIEEECKNDWFYENIYERYLLSNKPINFIEFEEDLKYYLDNKDTFVII